MADWIRSNASLTFNLSAGASVAAAVRATVQQSLGLTVSVGVAPNKLLAKLASRQAKPDGVAVVDSVERVQQLLTKTPVDRIPGQSDAWFLTVWKWRCAVTSTVVHGHPLVLGSTARHGGVPSCNVTCFCSTDDVVCAGRPSHGSVTGV